MGGYDRVSAGCGWASVAQAIGMDSRCGSAVKLVFFKYLDALERWVQRLSGKKVPGEYYASRHFGAKVLTEHFEVDGQSPTFSISKKNQSLTPFKGSGCNYQIDTNVNDNGGVVMLETSSVDGGIICQRKKQEALEGMLIWARYVARNPNFHCLGKLEGTNEGKAEDLAAEENHTRVLLARQALLLQKVVDQTSPEENQVLVHHVCLYF